MTIELELGEQGLSAHARTRLLRHLEQVRVAVVDLLGMDEQLRQRRIVFRSGVPAKTGSAAEHHAADHLMHERHGAEAHGKATPRASFSLHDGDLEVRIPHVLQNPGAIERLMVGQLLHVGLKIPPAISIRFLLDGVLGVLREQEAKKDKRSRLDMQLVSFLATRGPDGQPRPLQPFLSGHCTPEERPLYFAVATSFVTFLLKEYGPRRLSLFASNFKPQAPNEASRAAFNKPFHAMQTEWDAWAHKTHGLPLSLPGFVGKGLVLYCRRRLHAGIALAAMVPQLVYTLLMPVGLSILFDSGILKGDAHVISETLIWLTAGYAVSAIGGLAQDYSSSIAAAEGIAGLREKMFLKTQKLADDVLHQSDSGQLTSTFSSDLMLIETAVTRVLPNLLFRVILLLGSVVVAFSLEWRMALASVICLPVAFLAPRPLAKIATTASYERKSEDAALAGLVQENVVLSRTIRMFHLQQNRLAAFRKVIGLLAGKTERANVYSALAGRLTTVGASFVQLLVIGMGAVLSLYHHAGAGTVIAFIGLLLNMGGAIAVIADAIPLLIQSVGAWQRVDMLLEAPVSHEEELAEPPQPWNGVNESIVFKDVVFNYAGGDPILNRISFELSMGQSVAFVGPSGSGKSTILNLIQRHLEHTDGQILLDGTPINAVGSEDLRRRMATVAQDNPLFNLSVRENIRMGRFDATDQEIEAAAKAAEIHDGIMHMAHGYDTPVGEGGGHLSGGQRQRIAIARALLRNPSVLLLDEATSALDPASQNAINATLAKLRPGRMVLTVTHHLREAAEMDKVVVIRQGRVIEIGSHQELLDRGGLYAEMWKSEHGIELSDDGKSAGITADRLRAIDFFARLPDDKLAAIAGSMHSEKVEKGEVLVREGERPDRFYILARGKISLSVTGHDGRATAIRTLEGGDFFGETALVEDAPQADTAIAASTCSLLSLKRSSFIRALGNETGLRDSAEQAIHAYLEGRPDPFAGGSSASAGQQAPHQAERQPA
jgi:ATP-binding cassette subfamily B protein